MKLTKEQLKQIIKEELAGLSETYDDEDETYTEPRDLWMHKYSILIIGAMRQIGIPPDVIRPSEVLKLAIGLIDEFDGNIELAKAVAEAGAQEQSAMAPGYLKNKEELDQWADNFSRPGRQR